MQQATWVNRPEIDRALVPCMETQSQEGAGWGPLADPLADLDIQGSQL
jgi:hypothetical protein